MFPIIKTEITLNGVPMELFTHNSDTVIGSGFRNMNELWSIELDYLKNMIRRGSRVIDAGGNIGTTAIFLAKIQPGAIIYSFEPDPLNYALLNMNLELNQVRNVVTFNCALGKKDEYIPLYRNHVNYGDHRSAPPYSSDPDTHLFSTSSPRVFKVNPVAHLKRCLGVDAPQYIDLLRTDTQGADFEIIEACMPLFRQETAVLTTYSPYHLHRNGTKFKDIEKIVKNFVSTALFTITPPATMVEISNMNQLSTTFEGLGKEFTAFYHMALSNDALRLYEKKIKSQHGEDGIIEEIFTRIGTTNRFFVEFGVQDGIECNTANLVVHHHWSGLMIEGNSEFYRRLVQNYSPYPSVKLAYSFITRENIADTFKNNGVPQEFDLLSIDIDGMDYWVWQALKNYRPRVVVIECNPTFPPPIEMIAEYDPNFVFDGYKNYGASLSSMTKLGKKLGYVLVGMESCAVNAFFIRHDLVEKSGFKELSPLEAFRYPS